MRGSAAPARRPPPRLAYSRPRTASASVTADDLPTAAFLLVPPRVSSGRVGSAGNGRGAPGAAQQQQVGAPRVTLPFA